MRLILPVIACFLITASATAKDLGVHGETFEIKEEHLIEMFTRKLKQAEEDGRIAEMQAMMRERSRAAVERPKPVDGITPATRYFTFEYDPTVTAEENYTDHDGRVIVPAGTQANPFDHISMPYELLFIDGDRKVEIDWALSRYKELDGAAKIILINGAPLDIMRREKVRVYFDQLGLMSRQFELRHTPSRIFQTGRVLTIEEIPLEEDQDG